MDVELSTMTPPQVQQGGRGDRVARTREAIVSSTLTLAMEGEVAPIVRDIAKLAGVLHLWLCRQLDIHTADP